MKSNLENLYLNIKQCILILMKKYTIYSHNLVLLLLKKELYLVKFRLPNFATNFSLRQTKKARLSIWGYFGFKKFLSVSALISKLRICRRLMPRRRRHFIFYFMLFFWVSTFSAFSAQVTILQFEFSRKKCDAKTILQFDFLIIKLKFLYFVFKCIVNGI